MKLASIFFTASADNLRALAQRYKNSLIIKQIYKEMRHSQHLHCECRGTDNFNIFDPLRGFNEERASCMPALNKLNN